MINPYTALQLQEPPAWFAQAACGDPDVDLELFFPKKGQTGVAAKRICDTCPVRQQCLSYSIVNDEQWGVWGGLSERERRGPRMAYQQWKQEHPDEHEESDEVRHHVRHRVLPGSDR